MCGQNVNDDVQFVYAVDTRIGECHFSYCTPTDDALRLSSNMVSLDVHRVPLQVQSF